MTTPEQALEIAQRYLAEHRWWSVVAELLEDDRDYFVREELKPRQQWPLGPAALFISQATGEVRTEAWGNAFDKIDLMRPV